MPGSDEPAYEELEEALRALAYSSRLELVHLLRVPHALQEIRLPPGKPRAGDNPGRVMSKQAIHEHLEKLVAAGLVSSEEIERGGRRVRSFVVNTPRLYHVTEEFRRLTRIAVGPGGSREVTLGLQGGAPQAPAPGPKLVLVLGLFEGKAFPLRRADLQDGRGWVVGRKAGLHVELGYDPYVSLENSEIVLDQGRYVLLDLRASKNGTWLNWRRLGKDERAPLEPGDVIGVGRSLLVFRQA